MATFLRQSKIIPYFNIKKKYYFVTLTSNRLITASHVRSEKIFEALQRNPYFSKYEQKIVKLQQMSPEVFLQRIEEKEQKHKQKKEYQSMKKQFQAMQVAKPNSETGLQTKEAELNSIMKLDLIKDKSKEEIIEIWYQYHKQKDCISGVLSKKQFEKIFERGKMYKTFLLPLPRENGYEFIICQFHGNAIHMTPLLWYQAYKENTPECLTMIHYTELMDSKDIVLMKGDFDIKAINVNEAQCLGNELQMYYLSDHPQRLKLLQTFTEKPNEFEQMHLITNLETLSFDNEISSLPPTSKLQRSWISFELWKLNIFKKQSIVRAYSQVASENKYITTPIFYVNADPHIGHLYTAVLADSISRFNLMQDHVSLLSTGTDEHGIKVQKAAKDYNLPTNQYCKRMSLIFKQMCDTFKINYTNFITTTEPCHYETVQYFWRLLEERNHIYKGKYSGWYCISDEAFLSNQDLVERVTPLGETIKVSIESGHPVEWTEEENYKFQLSKFQNDLKYWMKDEKVVQPSTFHKILSNWIEDGSCLEDLSISRPVNRVPWAIPTPNDPSQTIYVWFDALLNYLTSLGYPNEKFKKFWPPTVQVIGKDILKFHGIYWPAFLIAAGLEPPKTLLCHSHWTIDHKKMSKSGGNAISPFGAAKLFTTEGLRYFLLRTSNMHKDCNYSTENVTDILNSDLANTFGNLVSRCTGKLVNPISEIPSAATYAKMLTSEPAEVLRKNIESLGNTAQQYYESFHINYVVDAVMTTLRSANVMIEYHKPWKLKNELHDASVAAELKSVIALALETTRISAIVLYPIIPQLSSDLLDYLNVPKSARSWRDTKPKYLNSLKSIKSESLSNTNLVLFPKIKLIR